MQSSEGEIGHKTRYIHLVHNVQGRLYTQKPSTIATGVGYGAVYVVMGQCAKPRHFISRQ